MQSAERCRYVGGNRHYLSLMEPEDTHDQVAIRYGVVRAHRRRVDHMVRGRDIGGGLRRQLHVEYGCRRGWRCNGSGSSRCASQHGHDDRDGHQHANPDHDTHQHANPDHDTHQHANPDHDTHQHANSDHDTHQHQHANSDHDTHQHANPDHDRHHHADLDGDQHGDGDSNRNARWRGG
jgi:hypothetical protein